MPRALEIVTKSVENNHLSAIEFKWKELERLNDTRNEVGQSCNEILRLLERHGYQPFCLKDYFLYSSRKNISMLFSALDGKLSEMEVILQESQPEWERHFESQKELFNEYSDKLICFLNELSKSRKSHHDGFAFFKEVECFKSEIQNKKNLVGYDTALNQLNRFTAKVDEYRLYFNVYHLMPETAEIRSLIVQINEKSAKSESQFDLEDQLEKKVKSLKETISRVKRECQVERVALQGAISNLHSPCPPLPSAMPAFYFFSMSQGVRSYRHLDPAYSDEWVDIDCDAFVKMRFDK